MVDKEVNWDIKTAEVCPFIKMNLSYVARLRKSPGHKTIRL